MKQWERELKKLPIYWVDPVWTTLLDVFACVLAGDEEEVYWCCGRLADRSIVVMDGNGNYYHVEKGKEKRYIACNTPRPGEEDFHTVMERLKEEAGRRMLRMLRWKLRFMRQRWECWCARRRSFQESGYSGYPVQDHADRGYALCKLQEIR